MNWALYGIRSTQNTSIYTYIYIYIGNEGVKHNNKFEEQRKTWKLELNLLKTSDGKNKHTEPTQEISKIGGLLWLAKSVRFRQTADRDITTCFCVCFFIHAVTFSLRFYFSEGEKRRPEIRLRLARYVTLQLLDFKTLDKGEQAFSYSHRGAKKGKVEGNLPPPPLIFLLWYDDIAQLKITFM